VRFSNAEMIVSRRRAPQAWGAWRFSASAAKLNNSTRPLSKAVGSGDWQAETTGF
jgi:hypothetical protein